MQLGRVIGNIVSTKKVENTTSLRMLIVQHLDENLQPQGKSYACIDTVNAKIGDIVLTCSSSSARMTSKTKSVCTDNSIVAIVEIISKNRKDIYRK